MKSFAPTRAQCLAMVSLSAGILGFAGCVGGTRGATYPMYDPSYDTRPPPYQQPVYAEQPGYNGQPVYVPQGTPQTVQTTFTQSDYVYYPAAEVYYSPARQQYIYREGRKWTTRHEAPPALNTGLLSVHVQLSDEPERHHTEIQRKYPHDWRPQQNDDHDQRRHRDSDDR
jgi:hypothetical protein